MKGLDLPEHLHSELQPKEGDASLSVAQVQVKEVLQYIDAFASKARCDGVWPDVTPWPKRTSARGAQRLLKARRPAPCHRAAALPVDEGQRLAVAHGHSLMLTDDVVWCLACGSRTRRRLRNLKGPCKGNPSAAGRKVIQRLGSRPDPRRLLRAELGEWRRGAPTGTTGADDAACAQAVAEGSRRWTALLDRVRAREAAAMI